LRRRVAGFYSAVDSFVMKIPTKMPRLKGYRFPRAVVAYAVWAYHRFALSTADVEDLLAERGVTVSRETVRKLAMPFRSIVRTA